MNTRRLQSAGLSFFLTVSIQFCKAETTNLTEQILQKRTFREGLTWIGYSEPTEAENVMLFDVLSHLHETSWPSRLEQFLAVYPRSPWAASLHHDYASFSRRTGRTTTALEQWQSSWDLVKDDTSPNGQALAGAILANWADLLSSLGRSERLKELIEAAEHRQFVNHQDRDKFEGAKNSYFLMLDHPGIAYRCGTFALRAVGLALQPTNRALETLPEIPSPTNGFSMAALLDFSKEYGLKMCAVRRTEGQPPIVPSVVHWRQHHFAALLEQRGDLFRVNDPTFGKETWIPLDVIDKESSGEFLIPATLLTNGWREIAASELERIRGMGLPNHVNDGFDKGCRPDFLGNKECPPCTGVPVFWVTEPYINLWIADEPLSYLTSRGESFTFRTTYKQRDTRMADNVLANTGWNHSWLSFVNLEYTQPCINCPPNTIPPFNQSNSRVFLPGGGEVDFNAGQSYDQETRLLLEQQNPIQTFQGGNDVGGNGGANGLRLVHSDGSQEIYGFVEGVDVPSGDYPQADCLMTRHIDSHGDTTWFTYGLLGTIPNTTNVLTFVTDPDGLTNTLIYTSQNLLQEVDNPYGLSVKFKYDTHGNLTNIVDAASLSSTVTYDTNAYPTALITPYGTNHFSLTFTNVPGQDNYGGHNVINRSVQVTDPIGATSLYVYRYDCSADTPLNMATNFPSSVVPTNTPLGTLDTGLGGTNQLANVCFRNSFYWGPRQYATLSTNNINSLTANDYLRARMRHWLQDNGDPDLSEYLSVERDFSPDGSTEGLKTFYDYQGKIFNHRSGTNPLPSVVAWRLPNGETHYQYAVFDYFGNITSLVSTYTLSNGALGTRTNQFLYANNTYTYAFNTQVTNYTIPNLLTTIIGADGTTNWSFGGFDTVSWTNYFNAISFTNVTTLTSLRTLPDYATNALGQIAIMTYTAGGRPITYFDLNRTNGGTNVYYGTPWAWTFPGYDKVITLTTVAGLTTTNVYNTNGFLVKTIDLPINATNAFGYATNGLISNITNSLGLNVTLTWDSLLRLTGMQFPDGTYTSNRYTALDVSGIKDRVGNWTSIGYDGARHPTSITNANNAVTVLTWCGCDSITGIEDALSNTTSFTYDNQGNLTTIVFPDTSSLSYQYDLARRATNIVDGANRSLQVAYNNQGLISSDTNAYGTALQVVYDILDRPSSITDANGVTATLTFDTLSRLVTRTWPTGGGTEGFLWSTNGLFAYTNQNSKVTWFTRNPAGWLLGVTNANFEISSFAYNPVGEITDLLDGRTNHTHWNYNIYGWLSNKLDAVSNEVIRFSYNANGQVTNKLTRQFGNEGYTYDPAGNLTNVTSAQFTNVYTFDPLNRLTNLVDNSGSTAFGYTTIGQLQTEKGPWSSDTLTYSYAQRLRQSLSLTSPSGTWSQTYGYDNAWRLQTLSSSAGSFGYGYTVNGVASPASFVRSISLPNTAWTTNHFDGVGRLDYTALINTWGFPLDAYSYAYDLSGQRTAITRDLGMTTNNVSIVYDPIGQITNWTGKEWSGTNRLNEQLGFKYDAAGNLLYRTNGSFLQTFANDSLNQLNFITNSGTFAENGATPTPATGLAVNSTNAQSYNDLTFVRTNFTVVNGLNTFSNFEQNTYGVKATNNLTMTLSNTVALLYDANGNLTNDGIRTFVYDPENRLLTNWVAAAWKSEFVYDGLGRRRIERDYNWQAGAWNKTNEIHFIYDGWLIVQERDANNNVFVNYTRGLDLSNAEQGAGGIGGLLARSDLNGSTFYHADASGNITGLVDANQNVQARYEYSPFARLVGKWGALADVNEMQFSSMPVHRLSGIVGYVGRGYEPTFQRWVQRDPIGEVGGINLYGFVDNSPINQIDPSGLWGVQFGKLKIGYGDPSVVFQRKDWDSFLAAAEKNPLRDLVDQLTGGAISKAWNWLNPPDLVPPGTQLGIVPWWLGGPKSPGPKCLIPEERIPARLYRGGGKNPGNLTPRPVDQGMLSTRDSLSNPWPLPSGQKPPLPVGEPIQVIDTSKLPPDSVVRDGAPFGPQPAGHVSIGPNVPPDVVKAAIIDTISRNATK